MKQFLNTLHSVLLIGVVYVLSAIAAHAQVKPLLADISGHDIVIHTAFDGTELMVFGARNDAGDVVVVVRGPDASATVRQKKRVFGMWMNRDKEHFHDVPVYYRLASSRPMEQLQHSVYYEALGIGQMAALHPYEPHPFVTSKAPVGLSARSKMYSEALLRYFYRADLYHGQPLKVEFIGESLFKAVIDFPDNTPRGDYTTEVYLFIDGEVVAVQSTPIRVYKQGFDAYIYALAHDYPAAYGLCAIALAIFFGWVANNVFHRLS